MKQKYQSDSALIVRRNFKDQSNAPMGESRISLAEQLASKMSSAELKELINNSKTIAMSDLDGESGVASGTPTVYKSLHPTFSSKKSGSSKSLAGFASQLSGESGRNNGDIFLRSSGRQSSSGPRYFQIKTEGGREEKSQITRESRGIDQIIFRVFLLCGSCMW